MQRKKIFWLISLLLLLAAAGGGYAYYNLAYRPAQAAAKAEPLQTATVRRGDLTVSAGGAGTLVAVQEASLGFRSSGTLVELAVQPGDGVAAGQVLARLDDTEARAQLAQAETNLRLARFKLNEADDTIAQAEANLRLARFKLDEADDTVAQAEANLRLVELKLETLLAGSDPSALATAQANLDSAKAELAELLDGPTDDEIAPAVIDMEQAAIAVKEAQAEYDKVAYADDVGASPQAAALQTATLAYEKNLAVYRQKIADPTPAQIAAAQAKVAQAQQQVDDLLAGAEADEVAAAQIAVEQAQVALAAARDTTTLEIGVEQAQVALAAARDTTTLEIGVEQAQLAVEAARRDLDALVLHAPFAGTVTGVTVAMGETVGATPILTLADLSRAQLELYLDETDLDKLAVGNQVEVSFDAWPDLPFTGLVIRIDPGLVTVDGVPAIGALAELEQPTPAQPSRFADGPSGPAVKLVLGMNAAVEVIAGRAEDALLVPVEALRELGSGQYAVFVLVEGQPTLRPVVVGLQDLTYAEILDGLAQGEIVTTGTVATE